MKRNAWQYVLVMMIGLLLWLVVRAQETEPAATPEATPAESYDFDWPPPAPSEAQIREARTCKIEDVMPARYPETLAVGDLADAFAVETTCDWAVLAAAYSRHIEPDSPLPEAAKQAFVRVIAENPAFAMTDSLFRSYFAAVSLVEPPPLALQPITALTVDYIWGGLGTPVKLHLDISTADSQPVVSGTQILGLRIYKDEFTRRHPLSMAV